MVKQEEINGYFLEIIRFLKSEYGYTQEFIVEKAKLGKSAISKIKRGENNVGDKTITKLCEAFSILNPDFFYGKSPYKTRREESEAKMEKALKEAQDACNDSKPSNLEEALKNEIANLKSLITDLRIQLNQQQERCEEQKDHVATLKRENALLHQQLSKYQADEVLGKFPFTPGVADKGDQESTRV